MTDHAPIGLAYVDDATQGEIERFCHREARLLDTEQLRPWLEEMVDPAIRYTMVMTQERFRKDKSGTDDREVYPYDDNYAALDLRVRQFETGLQTVMDPPQRIRRFLTNIEGFAGPGPGEFVVLCNGMATRNRRLTERTVTVYGRRDLLRRGADGKLRLVERRIDLDERVVRNKNLMFFL